MYDYIPHILPMTLEEAKAELDRRLWEEYAYGRLFKGPDLWDLNATISARKAERENKGK